MASANTERESNETPLLNLDDHLALVQNLLPSLRERTLGYILPFLIGGIFVLLMPRWVESRLLSLVFQTLAQIAGVLIGFTGLVGVFGMESIRSQQIDLDKQVWDLDLEHIRTHISSIESAKLEEYNKLLQARTDVIHILQEVHRITKHRWANDCFHNLLFFVTQAMFSILGLIYVTDSRIWPALLALTIAMLLEGAYATYLGFRSISVVIP